MSDMVTEPNAAYEAGSVYMSNMVKPNAAHEAGTVCMSDMITEPNATGRVSRMYQNEASVCIDIESNMG